MPAVFFPEELDRAAERFRKELLKEKKVIIFHDTDPDGIVSGALLKKFLEENGVKVEAFARERHEVEFSPGEAYVLADIRIDENILQKAKESGARIYYVDHHEPVGVTKNTIILNPWFVREGLPVEPYKYNTALLAWLVERMNEEDDWKVAAAHWADRAEGDHTKEWMEEMRKRYPVEEVGKVLSLPEHFPELSLDEIREKVKAAKEPEELLRDERIERMRKIIEEEINRWKGHIEEQLKRGSRVVYLVVESPVKKLRSILASLFTFDHPEVAFIIGQHDDGTVSYSMRMNAAGEKGVHLGEIAREAGKLFGGSGGGHPPAAGLRIPKEKEPEFREWVLKKLASLL
ncbi:MAG: DHH family phosphoesterase [Candidatus Diapherotrites archaeon]|nr:DHH family phosphoesterase [Candidatus Diapherotrites archaeon]